METSWRGIFDLGPDDTVEVRAGDLQEFLRQQMMGVTNPGLTVEVRDGQPSPAKSYDERVSEALRDPARDRQLQKLRREAGWRLPDMADQLNIPLRKYESYEKGESPIPRDDAYLIASRLGVSPAAVPDDLYAYVKADIDHFKADMRRHLPEVIDRAVAQAGILPVNCTVRDWYMHAFPEDELGSRISPELTFDAALEAVPRGSGFYDALGVGDSVVRERVFEELADRNGLTYEDVYEAWLDGKPVPGHGLLDTVYGHDVYDAIASGKGAKGISLNGEVAASRQAADQLANDMKRSNAPVHNGEIR